MCYLFETEFLCILFKSNNCSTQMNCMKFMKNIFYPYYFLLYEDKKVL